MRSSPPDRRARPLVIGVALMVLLAALAGRALLLNRPPVRAEPPPLAMDDSAAEIPTSPPPLPSDNSASLRAAMADLDKMATDRSVQGLDRLAAAAMDAGDLWRAETAARSALNISPADRMATLTLASTLRQECKFDPAEVIYKKLVGQDPRDSDAYLGMADTEFAANHRPAAFQWLERASRDGAQTALSLSTIAHRYQDWKDYPKAEEIAQRAVNVAPNDNAALLQLASIQVESGQLDRGYKTLEALLARDPSNGLAHRIMGVVLMNAGFAHKDVNRARRLLERAVELNPRDPDIYRSAALIYREQHLNRLAAQAYDVLLRLDPSSRDARYGLGQVYAILGKPELSKTQLALYEQLDARSRRYTPLTEDVAHHPLSAASHAALATFYESSGDFARALTQYQIASGLSPQDTSVRRKLDQLYSRAGLQPPVRPR